MVIQFFAIRQQTCIITYLYSCNFFIWGASLHMCTLFSTSIFYGPVVTTIRRRDGYKGIFGEEGVDTGAYLGGYHGFRVWKCKKMYFLHTRTSWDKYMFNGIPKLKILDTSELVRLRRKIYWAKYTLCTVTLIKQNSLILRPEIIIKEFGRVIYILDPLPLEFSYLGEQ